MVADIPAVNIDNIIGCRINMTSRGQGFVYNFQDCEFIV